jgi:hypothetical protein
MLEVVPLSPPLLSSLAKDLQSFIFIFSNSQNRVPEFSNQSQFGLWISMYDMAFRE